MTSLEQTSSIFLPRWESGDRSIRFLYLADCDSFKISQNCDTKEHMIPLFLGADLFSKTSIRTENHPRYHEKFAKKGLATKLVFSSGFRFHGLKLPTGNSSLWFYSIQGVFRVAFELFTQQEQLAVLETLQELWKSRMHDNPLDMCYYLKVQLDAPCLQHVMKIYDKELQLRLQSPRAMETLQDASTAHREVEGSPMADHNYCGPLGTACVDWHQKVSQKIRNLSAVVENLLGDRTGEQEMVLLLLEHTEQCLKNGQDEKRLSDLLLALLEVQSQDTRYQDSAYHSPLLCAIAGWLGHRFHAANTSVNQQVECFKVQHIDRITELPPAEELAAELFPEAMRVLLLNWMGLSDASAVWKRHSEYPILLLILEFANHNLITGVAHVLYSSLICK